MTKPTLKARRFSHEEGYTGSSISSTGAGISKKRAGSNRDSESISSISKNCAQVAKAVGRDAGEPDRSKSKTQEQSQEAKKAEIQLVKRQAKKYKWRDCILAYQGARERGYTRCFGCFAKTVRKLQEDKAKRVKKRRKNKPYQRAEYPGEKVQVDVKYVPSDCITDGRKYYQYTAVDECTRWTYRYMYDEHSTHSSIQFLHQLVKACPFQIKRIQTDNGTEWTKQLIANDSKDLTSFELGLKAYGIEYQRIRVATPRHNGKVERQHRIDQARFYSSLRIQCTCWLIS